jgi:hypothetical protein
VGRNRALRKMSPGTKASEGSSCFRYADFFSRAQLLPPQHPALADFIFIFAQQSPLQSPDFAQQAAFAVGWSFASGCALSLFMPSQHAQSLQAAFSLLHESSLQQAFLPEQHLPFFPLQQVWAF